MTRKLLLRKFLFSSPALSAKLFFALVRLDFSAIVSGDAVWLELKQPAEETQKQQKDEKETRRQSRVMQKGWLWACVCAGRREKRAKPGRRKRQSRGWFEKRGTGASYHFTDPFAGATLKQKDSQTQSEVTESTNPWSVTCRIISR